MESLCKTQTTWNIPDYNGNGVYCITNLINGKKYIGSSGNVKGRIKSHLNLLKRGAHSSRTMQFDFSKGDIFVVEILEKFGTSVNERRKMLTCEHNYIIKCNSIQDGYNKCAPSSEHPPIMPRKRYVFSLNKLQQQLTPLEGYETPKKKSRIKQLCRLLDCQPGDIIEFVDEPAE